MTQTPLKDPPARCATDVELELVKAAAGERGRELLAGNPAEMAALAMADPDQHLSAAVAGVKLARHLSLELPLPAARAAYVKADFSGEGLYLGVRSGPQHVMCKER